MFFRVIPALLLLGFSAVQLNRIKAFSPALPFARIRANELRNDHDLRRQPLFMAMDGGNLDRSPGKIVAERYLYRFSPTTSSVQTPYTIEERQYFSVAEDLSLQPFVGKSYIFRRGELKDDAVGNRLYTKIGSPLFTVDRVQERGNLEALGDQFGDGSLVMALFCMQHPEIVGGKGLELGSGFGVGGILSVIGAGIASEAAASVENQREDSLPAAPAPSALSEIVLTDSNEHLLNECLDNLEAASFDVSKVNLRLKRNKSVQDDMRNEFNFVIGCDCAHDVAPLAKSIAYSLRSSSYDVFLHVESQHNENGISGLGNELERGYLMNTKRSEIALERLHLLPLVMDSLDGVEAQMKEEVEGNPGSFVEYQRMEMNRYSALVGCHSEGYDGLNGEHFFPASQLESQLEAPNRMEVVFADSGDEERVRSTYKKWCDIYKREAVESRFYTFAFNFLEMEAYYREVGGKMQFHKYLDCTEEESILFSTGRKSEAYAEVDDELRFAAKVDIRLREIAAATEMKHRAIIQARMQKEAAEREKVARVHSVYLEWCEVYGKDVDDSRFKIFLFNFNAMKAHEAATGKTLVLNQWYDCTEEEHKLALEAETKVKADEEARVAAKAAALEMAEEQAKLATSAQLKIREKALEHKAKALEERRIAGEYWKKAEEQARLAAEVEAKAKGEDRLILAAESTVNIKALEEVKVAEEKRLTMSQTAAQIQHRAIVASRHHMLTSETENMARVQEIYLEWCDVFGKEINESRFYNFASNFLVMEANAKETGKPLDLNQWYDFTEEEFAKQTNPASHPSLSSIVEFVEVENEEAVNPEVFEADATIRQAWYHCTEEEYDALTSGKAIVKIQMAEESIKQALDVNFIESDATVGTRRLSGGNPVVPHWAPSQAHVHHV